MSEEGWCFIRTLLEKLELSLGQTIACWLIRWWRKVMDSVTPHKLCKLGTSKLWPNIFDEYLGQSMGWENGPEMLDGGGGVDRRNHPNFQPLEVCVNHQQKGVTYKRTCKICMLPLPWCTGKLPWINWSRSWVVSTQLAGFTLLDTLLNVVINPWPPHEGSGQSLHSVIHRVTFVE